ncbi:uncharacterized protein At4g19900-like [Gastrolobium bilobum]|uniref:uncharacterized protein At4g19900-like n=1 Tax=Gastrolobium bilobum TaxID=150636 RepID=UPI002AB087B4|nr:uncharacterized protein At4g19900-like [Gastrolobium bilobum]
MLRNLRSRRNHRYGVFLCAVVSAILLLVSVSLLHSRISYSHPRFPSHEVNYNSLLSDSVNDDATGGEDTIDALDVVGEQPPDTTDVEEDDEPLDQIKVSGYFFYHIGGVIRRAFSKGSVEDWDEDGFFLGSRVVEEDRSKAAFGSDDVPVDERVRMKVIKVRGVEDALLLKMGRRVSPLREGWGDWFDKKGDFLRKDKMLRSNLELLNPLRNPILQDPDGVGFTGLTRGDKILHKSLLNDFKRVPFPARKKTQDTN